MKNILFIIGSLGGGGAEKVLVDLLKRFDYSKYNVTLILLYGSGIHEASVPAQVEVIRLFERKQTKFDIRMFLFFNSLYKIYLQHKLKGAIADNNYDVVISFMEGHALLLHSFISERFKRNITWVHTDMNQFGWSQYIFGSRDKERKCYAKMDEIVFVSRGALEGFKKKFNINEGLRVIYNIIDQENVIVKSDEYLVEHKKFTICHVGRLNPVKRQERIIDVAHELRHRGLDFEVWIVGDGQCGEKLKNLVNEKNLQENVKFMGFQSNPYPYIKNADIFLLTSEAEGYPIVICESLTLGVPVISTDVSGPKEILCDGSGILTSFDINEIADRIEEFMKCPAKLNEYREISLKKSHEFNSAKTICEIEQIIENNQF